MHDKDSVEVQGVTYIYVGCMTGKTTLTAAIAQAIELDHSCLLVAAPEDQLETMIEEEFVEKFPIDYLIDKIDDFDYKEYTEQVEYPSPVSHKTPIVTGFIKPRRYRKQNR